MCKNAAEINVLKMKVQNVGRSSEVFSAADRLFVRNRNSYSKSLG